MNVEDLVKDSLVELASSGKLNTLVDKQIEETITRLMRETLGEHSPFGKALKAAIEAKLPTDFDSLRLATYNAFVIDVLNRKLEALANDDWKGHLTKLMDDMFEPFKKELTVTELAAIFQKHFREQTEDERDRPEHFTFILELDGSFMHIYVDEEEGQDKHRCKYRISAIKDRRDDRAHRVYGLDVEGKNVRGDLFKGPYYNIERALVAMFYGKTQLVCDVDSAHELDTSFAEGY